MQTNDYARDVSKMSWADLVKEPELIKVETLWRIFACHSFANKEIGATQYIETKKAFYVGFSECFKFMNDMACDLPEDKACEILSKINNECATYIDSLVEREFKR